MMLQEGFGDLIRSTPPEVTPRLGVKWGYGYGAIEKLPATTWRKISISDDGAPDSVYVDGLHVARHASICVEVLSVYVQRPEASSSCASTSVESVTRRTGIHSRASSRLRC